MHHSFIKLACLGLVLVGCDSGGPPAAKPADAKAAVASDQPEAAPVNSARPQISPELLAERGKQLEEERAIAAAYRAGTLGDRLVADRMLLVDARAPADTDQARYFVFTGKLPAPADFAALSEMKRSAGGKLKESLYGGDDSGRVALFRDIEPGAYTVCAVLSGPTDAAELEFLKKSEEAYKAADRDGKMTAEKLKAAADQAKAETGYEKQKIDWNSRPVRCNIAEVTADASTRVVVVG